MPCMHDWNTKYSHGFLEFRMAPTSGHLSPDSCKITFPSTVTSGPLTLRDVCSTISGHIGRTWLTRWKQDHSSFLNEKEVPTTLGCMHCQTANVLLQLLYVENRWTIFLTTHLHMHASTFLVLFGMPPSLESMAVFVVMVTLAFVASYIYNVFLVHKIIISVSLYATLTFSFFTISPPIFTISP